DANRLATHYSLFSFAIRLSASDYKTYYRDGKHPRRAPILGMYGMCFRTCLVEVPRRIVRYLKEPAIMDFILESGHKNWGGEVTIFADAKKVAPDDLRALLGSITIGAKRDYPGLQAADVTALGGALAEARGAAKTSFPRAVTLAEVEQIGGYKSPSFSMEI